MVLNNIISMFDFSAKKRKKKQQEFKGSYHYQRAMELLNHGNDSDAFDELKEELNVHPDNGFATLSIAEIYYNHNVLGTSLKACNDAISQLVECGENSDLSYIYYIRAKVYRALDDKAKWLEDIFKAIEYDANSVDALGQLGDYYYYSDDYNASDVQYNKIIELEPHNPYGYMGRGRNDQGRKEHKSAIAHFDRAMQMEPEYAAAYSFKAESLFELGKNSDAIDSLVEAVSYDMQDKKARSMMRDLASVEREGLCLKIKTKALQNPDNDNWYNLLGWLYAGNGQMTEAIVSYKKAYKISEAPILSHYTAFCWTQLGAYDEAVITEELAIKKAPQEIDCKTKLAVYKAEQGRFDDAISDLTALIEQQPDNQLFYFYRGRFLFEQERYEEAIKDFDTSLSLKNDLALTYLYKGWILIQMGKKDEAIEPLSKILDNDSMEESQTAMGLALYFLDRVDEAVSQCDSMVSDIDKVNRFRVDGNLYLFAAGTYSRAGNTAKAMECIKKSVECNTCRFWYMIHGKLLKPLQNNSEFLSFINDTQAKKNAEIADLRSILGKMDEKQLNTIKAEIPFVREGKMCKVKCEINGLPLHFIFDTGASEVTMSSVEATFMLKNGYLNESDLSGKKYYRTADGSIAEGVNICLKNVVFAGLTLSNVNAGVVTNQVAPLLLGQSVLERLGRIEIDNDNMLIRINK